MRQLLFSIREVIETLLLLVIAIIAFMFVRTYVAQPFLVQQESMQPTVKDGDYIIVDELSYRFQDPARFNIIVFKNPNNETQFFIKRIIGLPGETVTVRGDQVLVNSEPLEEKYLPSGFVYSGERVFRLSKDEYFVMGDNRPKSLDSRSWGPLRKTEIIGEVRVRLWPLNKIAIFSDAQGKS